MEEKKASGRNKAVTAIVIILLAVNFLQLRSVRRELEEVRISVNNGDSNLFGAVNEVKSQIAYSSSDIKEELQKSRSIFTDMSSTVKLQDGTLVVTMRAVPKEVLAQEKLFARLTVGTQVYEAEMGAGNQAVLSIDAADVVKPAFLLKSDSGTRQETGETLYMEEFLYCDTSSHWDAGRAVLNLVITPSDSVVLTEHDVEKAEFVVVSAGAAREFDNGGAGGSGSAYASASGGWGGRVYGEDYIPEPVELPVGDKVEARLWNGGAEGTLSYRGDFSEYINRNDGIRYEVYFILTTKEGIRFATRSGRCVADFCEAQGSSNRGENGGRLEFMTSR